MTQRAHTARRRGPATALGAWSVLALVAVGVPQRPLRGQAAPSPAAVTVDSSRHDAATSHRAHLTLVAAGALGAATFNQATAMPAAWPRTWRGYGARVADQAGFAVAEESLRAVLTRVSPWRAPRDAVAVPCEGAGPGHAWVARVGRAASCGIARTLVVRTASGARRPNVPLLGAIAGASALSLAWRPERADHGKGLVFVGTRFGVVTGGAALTDAWRALRDRE